MKWAGTWKGGRFRISANGYAIFVVEKMRDGKRYSVTLSARKEADAEAELEAFLGAPYHRPKRRKQRVDLRKGRKKTTQTMRLQAERQLRNLYGIDFEDWARLFEAQDGKCPGCDQALGFGPDAHVDHDHETDAVRGLVCSGCNHALGKVKDSPATLRRLADYIERPTQRVHNAATVSLDSTALRSL